MDEKPRFDSRFIVGIDQVDTENRRMFEIAGRVHDRLAAEGGLASAVAEQRARRWRETNQAALDSSNVYVEEHGLPLAKYRSF